MLEGRLRTNQRQHAAHTGRQVRLLNIQSGISRRLSVMTLRTQIPGAEELDLAHGGQHMPGTHLAVTGLVSAGTRDLALVRTGRIVTQQLAQGGCSGPMHRRPHGHLNRFQIEFAGLALLLKDEPEYRAYFPLDFLTDRFRRFFPAASACLRQASRGRSFHWSQSKSGSVPEIAGKQRSRARLCAAPPEWESSL